MSWTRFLLVLSTLLCIRIDGNGLVIMEGSPHVHDGDVGERERTETGKMTDCGCSHMM